MTQLEYEAKRNMIASSDAPLEVRTKAMEELEKNHGATSSAIARQQFEESRADTDDMGEHS